MNNTSLEALVFALIAVLGTGGPSAMKVWRDITQLWAALNLAVERLNGHDTALNGNLDARIEAAARRIVSAEIARLPAPVQLVIRQAEGVLTDALSTPVVPAALPRGGMASGVPPSGGAGPVSPGGAG